MSSRESQHNLYIQFKEVEVFVRANSKIELVNHLSCVGIHMHFNEQEGFDAMPWHCLFSEFRCRFWAFSCFSRQLTLIKVVATSSKALWGYLFMNGHTYHMPCNRCLNTPRFHHLWVDFHHLWGPTYLLRDYNSYGGILILWIGNLDDFLKDQCLRGWCGKNLWWLGLAKKDTTWRLMILI